MSSEQLIRYGSLGFMWVNYLSRGYILFRQHRVYNTAVRVPSELREIFPAYAYEQARSYEQHHNFRLMLDILATPVVHTLTIWWFDGIRFLWEFAGTVVRATGFQKSEIIQTVAYLLMLNTLYHFNQLIDDYCYYIITEEAYGFNRQTIKLFWVDEFIGFVFFQIISVPYMTGLVYVIKTGGNYFSLYLWLYMMAGGFLENIIYPEVELLFTTYIPLSDGELKTRVEDLAAEVGFQVNKIYVVKSSIQSLHTGANIYGFFKNERIFLMDTLLKDYTHIIGSAGERIGCDGDEVVGIIAHELGHWKLKHTSKLVAVTIVELLVLSLGFGVLYRYDAFYHAFGFRKEKPAIIGFSIALDLLFSPFNVLMDLCMTYLSRKFESEADAFAKSLGKGAYLRRALIKVDKDNLNFPIHDRLYSIWYDSHPPLLERLNALDKDD